MRFRSWLWLFFLMGVSVVCAAGDIQILCEPGLRIYLDDELVGTSIAKEDGLYLVDAPKGAHTIRVEKVGFLPQSFEVDVLHLPIELEVGEFTPRPSILDTMVAKPTPLPARELVGNLVVISAPQNCIVEIDGRTEEKHTPQISIGGLSAGEHTITFSKPGFEPVSGVVVVRPGVEATVRGNLKAGKVELIHTGKGSLRVISKPVRCTVRFLGMTREKIDSRLNVSRLPAGEHEMVFSISGRKMTRKVLIIDGQRTTVEVSFMKGDVPFVVSHTPLG